MLWNISVPSLVLWAVGFLGHVFGGLIHLVLIAAVILLIYNFLSNRRTI